MGWRWKAMPQLAVMLGWDHPPGQLRPRPCIMSDMQTDIQLSHLVAWGGGDGTDGPAPSMQMHPNASATNSHCKSNWFNGYTGCLNYTKHLKNKTTTCREKSMMHKIWKWKLMFFHQIMKFELFIKAVLLCWRHKLLLFLTKHICTTAKLNFSL